MERGWTEEKKKKYKWAEKNLYNYVLITLTENYGAQKYK